MIRSTYYDRDGIPISAERFYELKWGADGAISDYAIVGRDRVGDVEISTVWLGLNHSFTPGSRPVIFETMLCGGDHDQECVRYRALAEAQAGHAAVVDAVKAGRRIPA